MKTVLHKHINSVISKIENGYDDVATLTPDLDLIPYEMKNWVQIAGSVFFGESKNDEIYVCICLDGCGSDIILIYKKYGFRKENSDDAGVAKYYKLEEAGNIANEVEDIVVTLAGESIANSFVSEDVFTKILQASIAEQQMQLKKHKKKENVLAFGFTVVMFILIFLISWILTQLSSEIL